MEFLVLIFTFMSDFQNYQLKETLNEENIDNEIQLIKITFIRTIL